MSPFDRRRPRQLEPVRVVTATYALALAWLLTLAVLPLARGDAQQPLRHVALRVAATVPQATADTLRAAVASQLAGLAILTDWSASGVSAELGVIEVGRSEHEIVVQIIGPDGRPLAAPRRLPGPLAEVSASEVASIAHAFVLAASEAHASIAAAGASRESAGAAPSDGRTPPAPRTVGEPEASDEGELTGSTSAPAPPAVVTPRAVGSSSEARRDSSPRRAARSTARDHTGWRLRLVGLYSGAHDSAALGWQHGMRAESAIRLWRGTYAGAGYAYFAPRELNAPAARVRVEGHGLNAFAGLMRGFGGFGLGADLGFGATRSRRETLRITAGFAETPDAIRWEPRVALRAHALLRVQGVSRLTLDLAPALELAIARHEIVLGGDLENPLSSPRLLRIRVDVGACFDLL